MVDIVVKEFNELSAKELYNILQLRSEVFVVEQNCVYQDLDGKDLNALHIIGYKEKQVVAYTRAFKPSDYFQDASIGRVVVRKDQRKHKYGHDIMKASIRAIEEHFNETKIVLSAQTYLKHFYNSLGFIEIGDEYLEDGIPHIKMIRD